MKIGPALGLLLPAFVLAAALGGVPTAESADGLHLRLERSEPAADSVVAPPSEIRLIFSQSTQEGATSIRLLDSAGEPVPTGRPQASDDHTVHYVAVEHELESGGYTVAWRTMAQDGHVVRGEFDFTVRATEAP